MKAAVCVALSSQQPLWSHSPLVDCLPNGHWQMGPKIASVTPPAQTATVVGQRRCRFPIFQLLAARLPHCPHTHPYYWAVTHFFLRLLHLLSFCFYQATHLFSEQKLITSTGDASKTCLNTRLDLTLTWHWWIETLLRLDSWIKRTWIFKIKYLHFSNIF